MRVIRSLLTLGNSHIGQAIHAWSLPAVRTCPGRTPTCQEECYATRGYYHMPDVQGRLAWNLRQSRREGFAMRMIAEVKRKGALVVRVHVSGDFYSPEYAAQWLAVMRAVPSCTFYWYTRSWRVPAIEPVLAEMARLENVRAWYSTDRDTTEPMPMRPEVRVAYLQTVEGETDLRADLAFRSASVRSTPRVGLPVVCPKNLSAKPETNCGVCQKCWT